MIHLIALLIAGASAPADTYAIDPTVSHLSYHIVHKLHEVEAQSKAIEAKAILAADGTVQVMARAPVASFKSGDANRDEHMLEVMEAGTHPLVVFKATGHAEVPKTLPAVVTLPLTGELDFHGVHQVEQFPVSIDIAADGTAHVKGTMKVSLDKYKVDRPSLLFVKIDDVCTVGLDLTFKRVAP